MDRYETMLKKYENFWTMKFENIKNVLSKNVFILQNFE